MLNLSIEPWRAINDGVMGGVSSGQMTETDKGLAFRGTLSLENNGGFSSVRRMVNEDMTNIRGIRMMVRGDGRNYQFRLRQDMNFDGPAWRFEFPTSGELESIELNFADFQAVFRGRTLPNLGPVIPSKIRQFGFLVADKRAGEFSLEIHSIELLRG